MISTIALKRSLLVALPEPRPHREDIATWVDESPCLPVKAPPTQQRCGRGSEAHAIGRSRGGLSTKIHLAIDALGRPIRLLLTSGQAHESIYADLLLAGVPAGCVVADRGYDFDRAIAALEERGVTVCIPPRSTSPQRLWSKTLYRQRNLIERCFARLKQFRRVATRYDKTASTYIGFVPAAAKLWLA